MLSPKTLITMATKLYANDIIEALSVEIGSFSRSDGVCVGSLASNRFTSFNQG